MSGLRALLFVHLLLGTPAQAGCLQSLKSALFFWKTAQPAAKTMDAGVAAGALGIYRRYVQDWEKTFAHLKLDSSPQKIAEAANENTRKHRIYSATIGGEKVIFKNYEAGVQRDPIHEMAMYKLCEDLGIKTVGIRGYSYIDGSLSFATNFVDGSLLAIRHGPDFANTNTTKTPGTTHPATWPKIEAIGEKLKAAGIEARDLQFLITPEGEPYLMDVGDFYIPHPNDERDITRPVEGWTEYYLSIYRKVFTRDAKQNAN